ncbi:hypothetical protein [Xanthomonas sacchari]|uniref:Uncharacterized protein n=1 Tax=Xanthomonas sacchari TaxID=56458 RepID=A0A2P5Z119_9XANT|nr:hypothetical protein [Xanthomonas sacchari]MDV0439580.1 hypothetical protein [Xanthomonas sacchari]PPU81100.1 hypothetical protein XsacCFBP4641_16125 [Xanthomonas sacchari]
MSENPYATPQAQSTQSALPRAKAPDTIGRKIVVGCIVASLSAAIGLFSAVNRFASGNIAGGIGSSIDAVLIGAFAYGLYRNSRVAAILLAGYFILGRLMILTVGNINGLGIAVLIALAYLSAARGTFQYHRWLQQERRFPSSQRPRLSDDPLFRTPAIPPSAPPTSAEPSDAATTASAPAP